VVEVVDLMVVAVVEVVALEPQEVALVEYQLAVSNPSIQTYTQELITQLQ
jgi:hypothetical protein